ncbi:MULTISPECIES: hypothetical protein [unclassified Streptomyces]|uniref:hypothetical protein n=1 Tax=unclassified Streptomyces TaxID=2593676 RepID=UPI000B137BE7|nr:hypothetical protein [Streptomyces sp. TSRI0281]
MTGPDSAPTCPDTVRDNLRTTRTPAPRQEHAPAPTSADTARTRPDNPGEDSPDSVRVEYRARVPRRLLGAAIADAFGTIERAKAAARPHAPGPMRIPTLFVRDTTTPYVAPVVTPGCEWVIDGEGTPTRMWNGMCTRLDDRGHWWVRRTVRPGGQAPAGYVAADTDPATGITYGWQPADRSRWRDVLTEALANTPCNRASTYELVGPLVGRNPDDYQAHILLAHGWAPFNIRKDLATSPRGCISLHQWLHARRYEGIVWHHPDGRMAKLKAADFPTARTP